MRPFCFAAGLLLILCGAGLYFYFSLWDSDRNWWDIRAVFSALWLATIGLASFRLTDYQEVWETETWLCLSFAYGAFILGSCLAIPYGFSLRGHCSSVLKKRLKRIRFELRPQRLFWICFVVTTVGFVCFLANVWVKGYIPYFSSDIDAYVNFYTKFYLFSTAATMISGLSYYTLVTQKLSAWKKVFLCFSIAFSTFAYPTLVVSRGTFLTAALSLTTVVFFLHGRKLWILALCTAVTIGFYGIGTVGRGYTEEQKDAYFEPSYIGGTHSNDSSDSTDNSDPDDIYTDDSDGFQLSGSAAFVYTYLTVSHDNFNLAVRDLDSYSYGIRHLRPFNVFLRIPSLTQALDNTHHLQVRPHLNTISVIGDAYYDFGFAGVGILMFLWAFAFGLIQAYYLSHKGIFSLLALGVVMTPVTLCFFSVWMSLFQTWMHFGLVFLMFLAAYVSFVPKGQKTE